MKGYIYKLTLTENCKSFLKGEIYIGKHHGNDKNYYGSGKIVKNIASKYGKYIFKKEILCKDIDDSNLLNYLERYYISTYKTNRLIYGTGLNLTNGGDGKNKISKEVEESIKKINEEISQLNARKLDKLAHKNIYQYDVITGEYLNGFKTIREAAIQLNIVASSISEAAIGIKRKSAGGFLWAYVKQENLVVKYTHYKPVHRYDLNNNFIEGYNSIMEAEKSTGISNSNIGNALHGRSKTAGGYVWKYRN